jgi:hypothetical protein
VLEKFSRLRFQKVRSARWSDGDLRVRAAREWTAILDPQLVLPDEEEACRAISLAMNTDVIRAIWETVSGTYVFGLYRDGDVVRDFTVSDGVVSHSRGEQLSGEPRLADMTARDVMTLVEQTAVPLATVESARDLLHFRWELVEQENELDAAELNYHWPGFLHMMNLAAAQFPGQEKSTVTRVFGVAQGSEARAWMELRAALGLTDVAVGERGMVGEAGAPVAAGLVEWASDAPPHLLLRIEEPAPGYVMVGVFSHDGQVHTSLDLRLFGDGAQEIAAREEPRWRAWMEAHFPSVGSM